MPGSLLKNWRPELLAITGIVPVPRVHILRYKIKLGYFCSIWYMGRSSITTHSSCKSPQALHNGNAMHSAL